MTRSAAVLPAWGAAMAVSVLAVAAAGSVFGQSDARVAKETRIAVELARAANIPKQ